MDNKCNNDILVSVLYSYPNLTLNQSYFMLNNENVKPFFTRFEKTKMFFDHDTSLKCKDIYDSLLLQLNQKDKDMFESILKNI